MEIINKARRAGKTTDLIEMCINDKNNLSYIVCLDENRVRTVKKTIDKIKNSGISNHKKNMLAKNIIVTTYDKLPMYMRGSTRSRTKTYLDDVDTYLTTRLCCCVSKIEAMTVTKEN